MLEYSGSDVVEEKILSSKPIKKGLIVEVLSVGSILPPQVGLKFNPQYMYVWHQ